MFRSRYLTVLVVSIFVLIATSAVAQDEEKKIGLGVDLQNQTYELGVFLASFGSIPFLHCELAHRSHALLSVEHSTEPERLHRAIDRVSPGRVQGRVFGSKRFYFEY